MSNNLAGHLKPVTLLTMDPEPGTQTVSNTNIIIKHVKQKST